jgi:hypothetical protein
MKNLFSLLPYIVFLNKKIKKGSDFVNHYLSIGLY